MYDNFCTIITHTPRARRVSMKERDFHEYHAKPFVFRSTRRIMSCLVGSWRRAFMIHIADFAVISRARACHADPAFYASSCEREAQAKIVTSMTEMKLLCNSASLP